MTGSFFLLFLCAEIVMAMKRLASKAELSTSLHLGRAKVARHKRERDTELCPCYSSIISLGDGRTALSESGMGTWHHDVDFVRGPCCEPCSEVCGVTCTPMLYPFGGPLLRPSLPPLALLVTWLRLLLAYFLPIHSQETHGSPAELVERLGFGRVGGYEPAA